MHRWVVHACHCAGPRCFFPWAHPHGAQRHQLCRGTWGMLAICGTSPCSSSHCFCLMENVLISGATSKFLWCCFFRHPDSFKAEKHDSVPGGARLVLLNDLGRKIPGSLFALFTHLPSPAPSKVLRVQVCVSLLLCLLNKHTLQHQLDIFMYKL